VTESAALLHGEVNPNGNAVEYCHFDFGTTEAYEKSETCNPMPGAGTTPVAVSTALKGLTAGVTYHFRIVASGPGGTSETGDRTFSTLTPPPPSVLTGAASAIGEEAAMLNGTVNPNGGAVKDCHFEYGATSGYGKTVACKPSPGSGMAPVAVSATAEGLTAGSVYHFRVVATGPGGSSEGADQTFTTAKPPPLISPLPGPSERKPPSAGPTQAVLPFVAVVPAPQPDASLATTRIAVGRSGRLVLPVHCPSGESVCVGTVKLTTLNASVGRSRAPKGSRRVLTLAAGAFTVPGGRTRQITLRMRPRGRGLLAHRHSLSALVTLNAHDAAGADRTTRVTVALHLAKARRR
jgi:hypothetical protein